MNRNVWLTAFLLVIVVSVSGQSSRVWRTAADIREGAVGSVLGTVVDVEAARNRMQIEPDGDAYQRITVVGDAITTQFFGFGGIIQGSPEIFRGSSGFANVRVGDRLDVHGVGRPGGMIAADQVTLIGRAVEAGQVGVGTTRPGTSVSTPTNTIPSGEVTLGPGVAEGTVRQVNANEGRIVIQTPQRRMITVRGNRSTPVYFRGEVYRIANLEVGDVIRVEPDPRSAGADEITARSIEVTQSVQETAAARPADQRLTAVIGRVARVDAARNIIRVDSGREEVEVDLLRAADAAGRPVRAGDLRVGDSVDVTGSYSSNSEVFIASTIRFAAMGAETPAESEIVVPASREVGELVLVTFSGSVVESLQSSPTLVVQDRANGRAVHLFVTDDFVIRTRTGGYATAGTLKANVPVLVKAYRDEDGRLVAQTIRIR
ncbi:MAG TPA: DUF5666 domain-containing protein [Thermoanaerobaculia bacterium]|nr:DUF5666 domain-containing protein [Thermoanaerobaculia bacterium]